MTHKQALAPHDGACEVEAGIRSYVDIFARLGRIEACLDRIDRSRRERPTATVAPLRKPEPSPPVQKAQMKLD